MTCRSNCLWSSRFSSIKLVSSGRRTSNEQLLRWFSSSCWGPFYEHLMSCALQETTIIGHDLFRCSSKSPRSMPFCPQSVHLTFSSLRTSTTISSVMETKSSAIRGCRHFGQVQCSSSHRSMHWRQNLCRFLQLVETGWTNGWLQMQHFNEWWMVSSLTYSNPRLSAIAEQSYLKIKSIVSRITRTPTLESCVQIVFDLTCDLAPNNTTDFSSARAWTWAFVELSSSFLSPSLPFLF